MRVTSNLIFNQSALSMSKANERLLKVNEKISEQSDIVRPSDNPNGAAQVMSYGIENQHLEQYSNNMTLAKNALEYESVALGSLNDVLDEINGRMIQAVNGANSQEDLDALAGEMENLLIAAEDLMNSRDSDGKYIFAGSDSESPAFEKAPDGRYVFAGNEVQKKTQIADNITIETSDSGKKIFEEVWTRNTFTASASAGATLDYKITDQDAFDNFVEANFDAIAPPATNGFTLTTAAGAPDQFTLTNDDTGAVVATGDYRSGEPIVTDGMEFTLTGPVGSSVNMTLDTPTRDNVLNQVQGAIDALRDRSLTKAQRTEFMLSGTYSIENTQLSMGIASSAVGSRINTIDNRESHGSATEIFNTQAQESIGGLNVYKATTELQLSEAALSASQLLFGRISSLSLFNQL